MRKKPPIQNLKFKIKNNFVCLALALLAIMTSCQKVINVDLNSSSTQLVIVGTVTDQAGPYTVSLSQSVNYNEDNIFPPGTGALVTISDNTPFTETLKETSPGNYTTSILQGVPGRTYNLSVTYNGKIYTAASTMPFPVPIDSIYADTTRPRGFGGGGSGNTKRISIDVKFLDPVGIPNYYNFIEVVNGLTYNAISITSDYLQDGAMIIHTLPRDTAVHDGDSVRVAMQSIDKNVYTYYRTLASIIGGGGGLAQSPPANPTTNISNNALGYFSACSVRTRKLIVP